MATTKPRITITLEPHTHEVLSRLSRVGGDSMSQLVVGLLDLAVPSFERLVVVLERAQSAGDEVKAGLASSLQRAERDLLPAMVQALGQGDMFLRDLGVQAHAPGQPAGAIDTRRQPEAAAGGVRGRRAAHEVAAVLPQVAAEASTPVPVTRGSGSAKRRVGRSKPRVNPVPSAGSVG